MKSTLEHTSKVLAWSCSDTICREARSPLMRHHDLLASVSNPDWWVRNRQGAKRDCGKNEVECEWLVCTKARVIAAVSRFFACDFSWAFVCLSIVIITSPTLGEIFVQDVTALSPSSLSLIPLHSALLRVRCPCILINFKVRLYRNVVGCFSDFCWNVILNGKRKEKNEKKH